MNAVCVPAKEGASEKHIDRRDYALQHDATIDDRYLDHHP